MIPAPGKRNMHYNTGRSLCLYLLRAHGEETLARFVAFVREKKSGTKALEGATGMTLPMIEKAWHDSIRKINFGGDYALRSQEPRSDSSQGRQYSRSHSC